MPPLESAMRVAEPAPHLTAVLTALFILAVFAVVLPLTGEAVLLLNVLTTGWIPALWAARLGWADTVARSASASVDETSSARSAISAGPDRQRTDSC